MTEIRHRVSGVALRRVEGNTLVGADLSGTRAPYADLAAYDLTRAMVRAADLCQSDGRKVRADGADFSGADLSGGTWQCASFRGASLYGTRMLGMDLTDCRFDGARAGGASFQLSNLSRSVWDGADLSRSVFLQATLFQARMRGCVVRDGLMRHADLSGLDLTGSDLSAANLTGCSLRGAVMRECDLSMTNLAHADVAGADFSGATMLKTVLAGCRSLAEAKGLKDVVHAAPSSIDLVALEAGITRLPLAFLEGIGLEERQIAALRAVGA